MVEAGALGAGPSSAGRLRRDRFPRRLARRLGRRVDRHRRRLPASRETRAVRATKRHRPARAGEFVEIESRTDLVNDARSEEDANGRNAESIIHDRCAHSDLRTDDGGKSAVANEKILRLPDAFPHRRLDESVFRV